MTEKAKKLKAVLSSAAAHGRLVITGHDTPDVDSVVSSALMLSLCRAWDIPAQVVFPTRADEQSRRVLLRFGIDPDDWRGETSESDRLVLVDHHQALHAGVVCACIDHHPTAYPPECDFVWIKPTGACALMVVRLMEEAGVQPTRKQTEMTVCALYLDTIALRSVKIAPEEVAWARTQAKALGMDESWLEREGMNLADMARPVSELAMEGKKVYDFGGKRVASSYVQTDAMTPDILQAILNEVRAAIVREKVCLWVFLVHDPRRGCSERYDVAPDGTIREKHYDALTSRGKVVMPEVEAMLMEGKHG